MDVDLLVLLEPCVHLAELELNEPVEFVVMIHGRSCLRPPVTYDDVVDVVLLRLEGVNEVLVGHVLSLEEEVRVVRLQPAAHSNESAGRQGGMRTPGCSHKKRISGVDDVLAPEEDAHPPGGRLDVREGERERSKGDDAHGGSCTGGAAEERTGGRRRGTRAAVADRLRRPLSLLRAVAGALKYGAPPKTRSRGVGPRHTWGA